MSEARIITKRLLLKRLGGRGRTAIDRRLHFAVGAVSAERLRRLRGRVFHVRSEGDAAKMLAELRQLALDARAAGRERDFLAELDGREPASPGPEGGTSFETFAGQWLETCVRGQGETQSAEEADESIVRGHLVPFFGPLALSEITMEHVDRFKRQKRQQEHRPGAIYKSKTINNMLSVLRRVLNVAVEWGALAVSPLTPRMWVKTTEPDEERPWLTDAEAAQLRRWLLGRWQDEPGVWLAILTQLATGVRFSEVRALYGRDLVDLPLPAVWIRRSMARDKLSPTKNKRSRVAYLPHEVLRLLEHHASTAGGGFLFCGPRGTPLPNSTYNARLREACREAGIREVTSHALRHAAASSYARRGHGIKTVGALMGHLSTKSTERYLHAASGALHQAVEERWEGLEEVPGPSCTTRCLGSSSQPDRGVPAATSAAEGSA